MTDEEFCGRYKGDHSFEDGANQCRCGRAYLRAPRPADTPVKSSGEVVDLLGALQRSVDAAKARRQSGE